MIEKFCHNFVMFVADCLLSVVVIIGILIMHIIETAIVIFEGIFLIIVLAKMNRQKNIERSIFWKLCTFFEGLATRCESIRKKLEEQLTKKIQCFINAILLKGVKS
ncbi:MAG: hypothetical protein WC349_01365 [Patescibacteria group bacterium]|jgi:type IV secretory pathway VirB3-like protein